MRLNRHHLLRSSAFLARLSGVCFADGEGDQGGGGDGGNQPDPAAEAAAQAAKAEEWKATRVTLANGDETRAKVLEAYDDPDKLFGKLSAPEPLDWRKAMAGDDPDELKFLERYSDQAAARKAWKAATDKISNDGRVKIPGENATPEELAEYAKAMGVPEKPDGYQITAKPVAGYDVSDGDKAFLSGMTEKLHEAIARGAKPAEIVNLAHQMYYDAAAEAAVAGLEASANAALDGERENRELWGSQYETNIRLALAGAKHFFPGTDEQFDQLMGTKLETGHALFDHPLIQRMFAQITRQSGVVEDPYFQAARDNNKGFDPVKRKQEIMKLKDGSSADRAEYAKLSAPGGELEKLNAGLAKRQAA